MSDNKNFFAKQTDSSRVKATIISAYFPQYCKIISRRHVPRKFFSLIRFGERAGSRLNGIMHVWKKVYHTDASICESDGEVERTILSLPFDGHEQDVNAMLQLYDNAFTETTEATTETATETSDNTTETTETSAVTTETYDSTTETIRLMIKENPKITGKELASRCGITEDGVAYHIKKLKASGKIKRKGGARNGGEWVVM